MTAVRAIAIAGLGLGLAACATSQGPADTAAASSTGDTAQAVAAPCEGQSKNFGCYAIPATVPEEGGLVVESTGPSAEQYASGTLIMATDRIMLKAGDTVSVVTRDGLRTFAGPGTWGIPRQQASRTNYAYLVKPSPRDGSAGVRGNGAASGPQMLVIRGDPVALGWYAVGRRLPVASRICLPPDAQFLTLQRADGGLVTYGGGGCNRAIREPDPGLGEAGAGRGI